LVLLRRRYGEVVRLRLGPWVAHLITQPDHVERVLKDDASLFVKASNYDNQSRLIGEGLITADADEWREQRTAAMPAFHGKEIARFSDDVLPAVVDDVVRGLVAGSVVDIAALTKRLTLRAICLALFGHDVEGRLDDVLAALDGAARWGWDDMSAFLSGSSQEREAGLQQHLAVVDDVVYGIIDGGPPPGTLLAHLERDCRARFGDAWRQHLRDQMLTYLLAGHDTTAAALTFGLLALADHQDVDERVAAEARGLATLSYASVNALPYVQATVREVLRLWPPAWLFTRQATVDVEFGEWRVPRGSLLLISPFVTHRDPFLWPEPTAFRPARFLDDDGARADGFAYFPFGGGARSCIGAGLAQAEVRLVLCALLRRFRFTRPANSTTTTTTTTTALATRVTLTPATPPLLLVEERP
jgi:cytochrome P450